MHKRVKAIAVAIAVAFASLSPPPLNHVAHAAEVTTICTLPRVKHEIAHTFNIPSSPRDGTTVKCSTCGIACIEFKSVSFHPPGSPEGTTATRIERYEHDFDSGVAGEHCTDVHCTATGPHWECACGAILTSIDQQHQRSYCKIDGLGWKNYSCPTEKLVHVAKGDTVIFRQSTEANAAPISIYINDVLVDSTQLGRDVSYTFTATDTGNLKVVAGKWVHHGGDKNGSWANEVNPSFSMDVQSSIDSSGTKWILPEITHYNGTYVTGVKYSDGLTLYGGYHHLNDDKTVCNLTKHTAAYNLDCRKIKVTVEANERYYMTFTGGCKYGTYATLYLTDMDGNIVARSDTASMKTTTTSFVKLYTPSAGTYYLIPVFYDSQDRLYNSPSSAGEVTVRGKNLVTPLSQPQVISVTLSSPTVGYGAAAPTLTVTGAKTTLTYASSNANIATINSTGVITLCGVGSTKITITAMATGEWLQATKDVTLTVTKGDLSVKTPPNASAVSYGQTLASSTLSNGVTQNKSGNAVSGSYSWKSPTTIPENAKVYIVKFIPNEVSLYNY